MPSDITHTILDFIDITDLTKFAILSKLTYNLSKDKIQKYKEKDIFNVISFFTNHSKKKISLYDNAYNKPKAAENIKKIFKYISELFDFIEKFQIKELCFSGNSGIKHLWSIDEVIPAKEEVLPLLLKILDNVEMNYTLQNIHLGLFSRYIEGNQNLKRQLEHIIDEHHSLIACEIRNIGASVWSSVVGNNLYKISKGVLTWQHIDPRMFHNQEQNDDEYWDGDD
jgi:hypothetical protein